MSETRTNPILRLMPSFKDVAFLMPLVLLFKCLGGVRSLLDDGDAGWHIRTGEWILAHGQVPHTDLFSYTRPGAPWFAWEWLWDAGAAGLYHHGGLEAVILASMIVICFTIALLYWVLNRRTGNPLVAICVTLLAMAGSSVHWVVRPHLFTMFFLVVFLAILELVQEGRTKLLWLLPPITVLWTNLHGGFLAGILVLGAYAGGELMRALVVRSRDERRIAARAAVPYVLAAAGCLAASLVNPYFYHLHEHIWSYLTDPGLTQNIGEFQSTMLHPSVIRLFELMLVPALGAALWYGARKRFTEVLLVIGWAHLALVIVRNVPLFMIVAAPVVAGAMTDWIAVLKQAQVSGWIRQAAATLQEIADEIKPLERPWRVHALPVLAVAAMAVGMASPRAGADLKPDFGEQSANHYPADALASLAGAHHIFTTDDWGNYLIYRLSPLGTKVFIDGRSDFYGGKLNQLYAQILTVNYDWEQDLAQYGVDTVLLPPGYALASAMKESHNWRVIYDDGRSIVFRSNVAGAERDKSVSAGGRVVDLRVKAIAGASSTVRPLTAAE